jgi:chromosome segregation ATPase
MLDYSSERPQPVKNQASSAVGTDIKAVHDNLAQMTTVVTQLSNVVVALRDQVAKLDAELAELRPQLSAFKVHIDSFPNALREARRSDHAVQQSLAEFEARLRKCESRNRS